MTNSWQEARRLWQAAEDRPVASRGAVMVLRRHGTEADIVGRMARFERFCVRTQGLPLIWGQTDCSLLLADWALDNGHVDPAAAWRGVYASEAQCRDLIAEKGDLVDVVRGCAQVAGLKRLAEPEFGAVAVIGSKSNPQRQWGAIWNGRRWLVKWGDERRAGWEPMAALALGIWRI